MDFLRILQDLKDQRDRIVRAITVLEQLAGMGVKAPRGSKRGRKFIDPEERSAISARMKRYWAGRRLEKRNGTQQKR